MKKVLLTWKEPKLYKKYLKTNRTLKTKIIVNFISITFFTVMWIIIWFMYRINPRKNAISLIEMLPLAVGAGIAFTLITKLSSYLNYDTIKYYDGYLFFFSNGSGNKIKYNDILYYKFITVPVKEQVFDFFEICVKEKTKERMFRIELDNNININEIKKVCRDKGINEL